MIQSRKLVAAAILFGLLLIVAGLLAAPFSASARASSSPVAVDVAGDRIGAAFASFADEAPDAALASAAASLSKGDLGPSVNCAGAVWPNIDASCLSTADGSPAPRVRTVTIGYQAGQNTTVLVRVPTSAMSQR